MNKIISNRLRVESQVLSHAIRSGVTIVEVLFAMFVVLFGLVGLAALLPLASRQASDSYMMTQGTAMMENTASEMLSSKGYAPSAERAWWYADDNMPTTVTVPDYNVANSVSDLYSNLQANIRTRTPHRAFGVNQESVQSYTRESFAYGFCIDPLFCADQFSTGWRYGNNAAYTPGRKSATQLLFRRTRMPFFDEHAFLDGNFVTGAVDFADLVGTASGYSAINPAVLFPSDIVEFPRLVRVSFPSGNFAGAEPLPLTTTMAEKLVAATGDLIQADATEDKSFGSLRGFQVSAGDGFLRSPSNSNLTWMVTLTPSEQTTVGILPKQFDLSFVVMNRRDRLFDAAPTGITGSDTYPQDEKIAYATSTSLNNATVPFWTLTGSVSLDDLPQSTGGTLELKLWGAELTDPTIRVGDWVMLSRKLSLNDVGGPGAPPPNPKYNPKLIHRHRWYRVVGTDANKTWPRIIRVAGDAWDYPEFESPPTPPLTRNHGFNDTNITHLRSVITTVTICRSVKMVYQKVVSLE